MKSTNNVSDLVWKYFSAYQPRKRQAVKSLLTFLTTAAASLALAAPATADAQSQEASSRPSKSDETFFGSANLAATLTKNGLIDELPAHARRASSLTIG